MADKIQLALVYIRNGKEMIFPVRDVDQAVQLADAIADSDLLNDCIAYNLFDVCQYHNGDIGEPWESKDEEDFEEYWRSCRNRKKAE